ncbi:rusticyanin precursor [Desulfosporosinus acididurans]|uniref:Rusticyanin n=1 Tax=Desulfosporosinus acididurans TaxID=476652 RepID=A0A0J1ISJ3_9FIRM|nr:hypothetical protein [Desulfosporosinus acididurans]KLU67626.1 rusticyanin precursor [Desulfosporosinus acididurans]
MKKTKWIVGLSIASLIAFSGSVYAAMNSKSVIPHSSGNNSNYLLTVYKNPTSQTAANTSASNFADDNSNTSPGSYGFPGGYGMMGGYYSNSSGNNGSGNNSFSNGQTGGYCGGSGFMNGYGYGNGNGNTYSQSLKDATSAANEMNSSLTNATVDKNSNTITYTGSAIKIVMLGGPEEADGKFVIGGLINPTLKIPQGANVTLEIINEDKGMPHGVELTTAAPPYAYMPMMQGATYPGSFIPPVPESANNQYPSAQVSFSASQTGEFYYICQYPGHAAKGMFGKIVIG